MIGRRLSFWDWPIWFQLPIWAAVIYYLAAGAYFAQNKKEETTQKPVEVKVVLPPVTPSDPPVEEEASKPQEPIWTPHPVETQYTADEWIETVRDSGGLGTSYAQHLRLKTGDRILGEFVLIQIYNDSYWKLSSTSELYEGDRRPATEKFIAHVKSEKFQQLLINSDEILCVGLASHFGTPEKQEILSLNRGDKLCSMMQRAMSTNSEKPLHRIGLGYCLDNPKEADETVIYTMTEEKNTEIEAGSDPVREALNQQRSAVVIGLKLYDEHFSRDVLYRELVQRSNLTRVDLSRYSRSNSPRSKAPVEPEQ